MTAGPSPSHADMWITYQGRRMRAIYRAENGDGTAFLVKYSRDHHNSISWIPHTCVDEFTREPARVVQEPSAKTAERLRREIAAAQEAAAADA